MISKGLKASAILMFIHGSIELLGIIALLPTVGRTVSKDIEFTIMIGLLWGIIRWIGGLGVWKLQRWAIIFGMIISSISLQTAITLKPYGIMDILFAAPVLILLLRAWFRQTTIE